MSTTRRQLLTTALAAAAFAATAHGQTTRVTTLPYPSGVSRVGPNPSYNEPTTIGETLRIQSGGRERSVHLYIPEGSGSRRSILLLHGAKRSGRSMLDMWKAAADRNGTVLIAPDAAGEGWEPQVDTPELMIDALNAAAGKVPLDPARLTLFGHSSGGMLAQLYANQLPGPWRAVATHGAALPTESFQSPAASSVPIRLYIGTGDHLFPPRQGRVTTDALAAAGHPADMIEIADHTHWYYTIGPWLAQDCMDWFTERLAG